MKRDSPERFSAMFSALPRLVENEKNLQQSPKLRWLKLAAKHYCRC